MRINQFAYPPSQIGELRQSFRCPITPLQNVFSSSGVASQTKERLNPDDSDRESFISKISFSLKV